MKPEEKKLLNIYRKLSDTDQHVLEKFASFLRSNTEEKQEPLPEPALVPAKPNETVVGALKRLSASYPMLEKSIMLNKTSTLMTQHIMQGRAKEEVILELELVFSDQFQELKKQSESK